MQNISRTTNYDVVVRSDTNSLLIVEANFFFFCCSAEDEFEDRGNVLIAEWYFRVDTAWKFLRRFLMFSSPIADLLHWAASFSV